VRVEGGPAAVVDPPAVQLRARERQQFEHGEPPHRAARGRYVPKIVCLLRGRDVERSIQLRLPARAQRRHIDRVARRARNAGTGTGIVVSGLHRMVFTDPLLAAATSAA